MIASRELVGVFETPRGTVTVERLPCPEDRGPDIRRARVVRAVAEQLELVKALGWTRKGAARATQEH